MKRCPSCQATYADDQAFCSNDGTQLVDDAPPSDLAKTVVAQPPAPPSPPAQNAGSDIPPTQVVGSAPPYDNRAQQPPSPATQYAPYAPEQPQPYAPQYQQQYAPQQPYGAPPKTNRKLLYIGIASVVALAGVGLLLWFLLSGAKSLGTYKGSLSDLVPEKVGSYSRTSNGTLDDLDRGADREAKQFLNYNEVRTGKYESSGKQMVLIVANFSSPEQAKEALNKIKGEMRGPGVNQKDQGKSKKDGERIVYGIRNRPNSPEMTVVLWTNGSVGFAAVPAAMFNRGPGSDNNVANSDDALDFEKNFPY